MKEEKIKFIISKTITFALIFIFILLFKEIFGAENTLIGVTTITGALLFLERSLIRRPFKYLFELIIVNVSLGFLAYFAGVNFILAFVCNFIAMFFIGYVFSYEVRANMYVPFGLQYVFMLAVPIEFSGMYNRVASLVFGAIFIMILQVLFNKDKFEKGMKKEIKELFIIGRKILQERDEKSLENLSNNFNKISTDIKESIYNNRKEEWYLENRNRAILDIILFLKNLIIEKNNEEENEEKIIILKEIEERIEKEKEIGSLLENKYLDNNLDLKYICELLNELNLKGRELNNRSTNEMTTRIKELKKHLNKNSMKFRYALKLGLAIGSMGSLIQYFNIFQGKWILFTIFALIQPYSEQGTIRVKGRIEGSLVGAVIAFILFMIAKNQIIQSFIVMIAGYLDCYHKTYKEKMIYITISAIGSSLVLGGTIKMVLTRIILIFIGVLISILFNKVILPYSIEDAKRDLIKMYRENSEKMIAQIEKENKEGLLENHYIIGTLIEKKLNEFNVSNIIRENKEEVLSKYYKFKKNNIKAKI
ncbi:MAG: FUSC family protein [Clostridium sp.]|uniref:FUSC family protein n=1 Tax=Clostridium sp. TaxID=1506 RepID=UPI003EE71DD9